ncbi:DUF421 domain-containing protein [Chimaeribacter arupi]|uniref:DUF421 domain-containing protein n=2 Tax=Yersiniaceae TaxID=1903411 RepID=A0A2N5EQZ5_9GAMM|nr:MULTISPECIES: YetF domain-containing protein [Yersiniaceae]MBS0970942.1 DUF421 domain-containing protein [Nissabacter archeti]PLR36680.1 DUF421 domain-containing protein [Chimaeribacter arupi]PLR41959.1 DUF421 domain-containing protein [Chimaeribacter arupi]PLR42622.1 DUF421 domain-containing protein [Chimaeribacter arupi]PLR52140.1 DUF421 domain-containing protein [Chimaeribacter arupi]
MDMVLRAACMYLFLMLVFKIAGRRTILQMTSFDFILLLIISEATQQALLGDDFSLFGAFITIGTLIAIDILLSMLKDKVPAADLLLDGSPIILIENGKTLDKRMVQLRISLEDVMEVARQEQGLEQASQIKYAILETNGKISVIPQKEA